MDVLGAIDEKKDGVKVTEIMYRSNVNLYVLKKNLGVALKRGDVKESGTANKRRFTLSDQGTRMYAGWKQYEEFSKELEKLEI